MCYNQHRNNNNFTYNLNQATKAICVIIAIFAALTRCVAYNQNASALSKESSRIFKNTTPERHLAKLDGQTDSLVSPFA